MKNMEAKHTSMKGGSCTAVQGESGSGAEIVKTLRSTSIGVAIRHFFWTIESNIPLHTLYTDLENRKSGY